MSQYSTSATSDSESEPIAHFANAGYFLESSSCTSSSSEDTESSLGWMPQRRKRPRTGRLLDSEESSDSEEDVKDDVLCLLHHGRRSSKVTHRRLVSESNSPEESVGEEESGEEAEEEVEMERKGAQEDSDSQTEAFHFSVARRKRSVGVRLSSDEDDRREFVKAEVKEGFTDVTSLDLDSCNSTSETLHASSGLGEQDSSGGYVLKSNSESHGMYMYSSESVRGGVRRRKRGKAPRILEYDSEEESSSVCGAAKNGTAAVSSSTADRTKPWKSSGYCRGQSCQTKVVILASSDADEDKASICSGYLSPTRDSCQVSPLDLKFSEATSTTRNVSDSESSRLAPSYSAEWRGNYANPEDRNNDSGEDDEFKVSTSVALTDKTSATPRRKHGQTGKKRKRTRRKKMRKNPTAGQKGKGMGKSVKGKGTAMKRKRKRQGRTGRKKRKKSLRNDSTYNPHKQFPIAHDGSPRKTRALAANTRARTAATHSPHIQLIRVAVFESHRHPDTKKGLQSAQAVMMNQFRRQRRESLQNSSFRSSTVPDMASSSPSSACRNFITPQSGYNTPRKAGVKPEAKGELSSPLSSLSSKSARSVNDWVKPRSILPAVSDKEDLSSHGSTSFASQKGTEGNDKAMPRQ